MSPKESIKNDRFVKLIKDGVKSLGVRGLARAVGISPAIITRYVQGKVGEPSQATLEKLAEYFKVPVNCLRGESDKLSTKASVEEEVELHLRALRDLAEFYTIIPDKFAGSLDYLAQLLLTDTAEDMYFYGNDIAENDKEEIIRLMDIIENLLTTAWNTPLGRVKKKATD